MKEFTDYGRGDPGEPVGSPGGDRHYVGEAVEPIHLGMDLPFWKGSVIKYVARAGRKGREEVDLAKAIWYLALRLARLGERDQVMQAIESAFAKADTFPAAEESDE